MGKQGQWVNEPGNTELKEGSLNVGDRWFIPYGSTNELPIPREGFYWELDQETPTGRFYRFHKKNTEQIIKDLEQTISELEARNRSLERESNTTRRALNKAIEDKKSITEAFDNRGKLVEDLESRIIQATREIANTAERIEQGHIQNKKLQEQADKFRGLYHEQAAEIKVLNQKYDDLYITNRTNVDALHKAYLVIENSKPEETDKECAVAEQSPEAKAYEDMHTKRMAAETESIELDNKLKRDRLKFRNDYPEGVWERLDVRTKDTLDLISTKATLLWGAIIVISINEVVQWVTQ